jgi:hypothetical protein
MVHLEIIDGKMDESRPQSCYSIKYQHLFAAPELFQDPAEHEYPEHVKKDMSQVGMHEYVGGNLVWLKKGRFHAEQGEVPEHKVGMEYVNRKLGSSKKEYVDNDNILNHGGKGQAATGTKETHNSVFTGLIGKYRIVLANAPASFYFKRQVLSLRE